VTFWKKLRERQAKRLNAEGREEERREEKKDAHASAACGAPEEKPKSRQDAGGTKSRVGDGARIR
jgi:hypothetical protein